MHTCTVEGCKNRHYAKGMCANHYRKQWERSGVPPEWTRVPARIRFWRKVDTSGECWLWTGGTDNKGYGRFCADGRTYLAHRYAWEDLHGPIPPGKDVCHDCPGEDNPLCVRHGFLGTRQEHAADTKRKGQYATGDRNGSRLHPERLRRGDNHPKKFGRGVMYGEANPKAKLTWAIVRSIRASYKPRVCTREMLALQHGVSKSLISQIVRGCIWKER